MDPEPETASPRSNAADRLTDELTRLRWRGVERIDGKQPVYLPILEMLAARHPGAEGSSRATQIRRLLADALKNYEADKSSQADAEFITSLLVDDKGRWPGPGGPGVLLDQAQEAAGKKGRQFREYQRERFAAFAHYLLDFSGTSLEEVPPSAPHRQMSPRALAVIAVAAAVVIGGIILGVVLSSGPPQQRHAGATGPGSNTPTATPVQKVSFRFDNLGSTMQGGNTILVYPGAGTSSADRHSDGEYPVGDVVPAICIATGRMVRSDPALGETKKQSDQWIRIASTDGQVQYATLTYGELIPRHAKLPRC